MDDKRTPPQAVLFDLDDTLLYNDMETAFLPHYFSLLTEYARPIAGPQEFMALLMASTQAMIRHQDPGQTNEEAFAAVFAGRLGRPWAEYRAFFGRFYEEKFPQLRVYTRPHPDARRVVQACLDAGLAIVIATNPLFPARAIEQRIAWAGLEDMPFDLVTTYENMHACKPAPAYYLEIAEQIDVPSPACCMVGNDLERDIVPARQAGMHTFLVDEAPAEDGPQAEPDRRGRLVELLDWLHDTLSG
jgi:HAD superfamily hydrolase (TIGR01509 family)